MAYPNKISVLLLREADWWVAQCLECDIAAQAKTIKDALREIIAVINGRITVCEAEGIDPFDLPKAPDYYWNLFATAPELKFQEEPWQSVTTSHLIHSQKEVRLYA